MRLRKEYAWTALALVASVAQFACSSKDEAAAPITTASMHEPTADQPAANPDAVEAKRALATLSVASASSVSGDLHFEQRSDGLWVEGNVTGLSPGAHGIQVHEKGDCTADDASSAGEPFPSATEAAATTAQTSPAEQPGATAQQAPAATEPSATTAQNSPTTQPNAGTAQTAPATEPMGATSQAPVGTQPGATTQAPSGAGVLGNIEADASGDAKVAILAKNVSLDEANPILDRSVLIYADQIAAQASTDAGDPVACGVIRSTAAAPSQNPGQDTTDFSMHGDEEPASTGGTGSEE
jgi:Cu/Zn superoxide dismutase